VQNVVDKLSTYFIQHRRHEINMYVTKFRYYGRRILTG